MYYFQVNDWKILEEASLDPEDWGWTTRDGEYFPIYSKEPVAPEKLLKFIRCNCKLETKKPCSTNCSCRKNGLHCVAACGNCRGENCTNENPKLKNERDDTEDEDDYERNIFDVFDDI
jgi:hypothetical protein